MASTRSAPDFQLHDDGRKVDDLVRSAVSQITVDERVNQAAVATIELRDDDGMLSDGTKFKVGSELRIELGYVGATRCLFEGEVTGWRGAFPRRGPRRLVVQAHDRFHRLRRERKRRTFLAMKDSEIARQVATDHGLSVEGGATAIKHDYVIQANEPDADFLLARAALAGFECFVEGAKKLVFRTPRLDAAAAVTLTWHENLKRFAPIVSVAEVPRKVTATAYDAKQKKLVRHESEKGDGPPLMGGVKAGADLAPDLARERHFAWLPLLAREEMEALAKGIFARGALRLVTGEGAAEGSVAIRRGAIVQVDAIGDLLSGPYYVDTAIHTLVPAQGYTTTFRVRRTALVKPPPPPPPPRTSATATGSAVETASGNVEFLVKNQFGDPVDGLEYVLTAPDGETKTGAVPANGAVGVKDAKGGSYVFAIKGVDVPLIEPADDDRPAPEAPPPEKPDPPVQGLPAGKPTTFATRLTDAEGRPLAGVSVVFQVGDEKVPATTDADGVAKIEAPHPGKPVTLSIEESEELRDQVRPRFSRPDEPGKVLPAENVVELGGAES